jgi:hypothetical protein
VTQNSGEYQRWEQRFDFPDYAFGKEPNYFLASCKPLLPRLARMSPMRCYLRAVRLMTAGHAAIRGAVCDAQQELVLVPGQNSGGRPFGLVGQLLISCSKFQVSRSELRGTDRSQPAAFFCSLGIGRRWRSVPMQMGYVRHGTAPCVPPDAVVATMADGCCSGLKVPVRIPGHFQAVSELNKRTKVFIAVEPGDPGAER